MPGEVKDSSLGAPTAIERGAALVVQAGAHRFAVPIAHVVETLRPRPLHALRASPDFVRGLAVLRGELTPVVDLHALVHGRPSTATTRLVLVRVATRRVALAVDVVVGVASLDVPSVEGLPDACGPVARAIAAARSKALDLVLLLDLVRLVPAETFVEVEP